MSEESKEEERKPSTVKATKKSGFVNKNLYRLYNPEDFEGNPFKISGEVVEVIEFRKKRPAELMGINISSIGEGNIDTTIEMMERSCTPSMTLEEINNLDLPVVLEATGVFKTFFMGTQSVMSEK